jgi:hypothetical protein
MGFFIVLANISLVLETVPDKTGWTEPPHSNATVVGGDCKGNASRSLTPVAIFC